MRLQSNSFRLSSTNKAKEDSPFSWSPRKLAPLARLGGAKDFINGRLIHFSSKISLLLGCMRDNLEVKGEDKNYLIYPNRP